MLVLGQRPKLSLIFFGIVTQDRHFFFFFFSLTLLSDKQNCSFGTWWNNYLPSRRYNVELVFGFWGKRFRTLNRRIKTTSAPDRRLCAQPERCFCEYCSPAGAARYVELVFNAAIAKRIEIIIIIILKIKKTDIFGRIEGILQSRCWCRRRV